ncbi:MAG TPA: ubiquinone/menaquinone biosynthesis methyltransferase [Acidimicrobiia bacterium]|nr:ubiquinone/menaquinone biosynthesis methyltransferase [Acidimicrobiia bacterium]
MSPLAVRRPSLPEGDEKRHEVERMFDRVAPSYDRMNRVISLGLDRGWRRHTVDELELSPGSLVLDLACGTGDLCNDLTAGGFAAVGVDSSAGMLGAAHAGVPLVRGDAARLPIRDANFDGVVCGFALRNFVELTSVFSEIARVLRRGGRFAALDATVPSNPLLRAGNALWFRGAVPLLGRILAHDRQAYSYLPRSTAYLPTPAVLGDALGEAGFCDARHHTLTGGSVLVLTATRA